MIITLPPEIEAALAEEAHRQGMTLEQVALQSLRQQFVHPSHDLSTMDESETLADLLVDFIGVLHSRQLVPGGGHLSEDTGQAFTELVRTKHQQRHQ